VLDGILLERAGIPAVSIVTKPFRITGKEMAKNWGIPDYRFLDMPHPIANLTESELNNRSEGLVEALIQLFKEGQP
jgi:hypothetical protein